MPKDFMSSAVNAVTDAVTNSNPFARDIAKKDKAIIQALMINGFKTKDIISFVDVYKSDVEAYVQTCKEAAKLAKHMAPKHEEPKSA